MCSESWLETGSVKWQDKAKYCPLLKESILSSISSWRQLLGMRLNNDIDILSGLMIEAANTDGEVAQEELNKISHSLINVFKEDPKVVEISLTKAFENRDNSKSLYYYTSKLNKSYSNNSKISPFLENNPAKILLFSKGCLNKVHKILFFESSKLLCSFDW